MTGGSTQGLLYDSMGYQVYLTYHLLLKKHQLLKLILKFVKNEFHNSFLTNFKIHFSN